MADQFPRKHTVDYRIRRSIKYIRQCHRINAHKDYVNSRMAISKVQAARMIRDLTDWKLQTIVDYLNMSNVDADAWLTEQSSLAVDTYGF